METHADGQRHTRPPATSGCDPWRFFNAESAGYLHAKKTSRSRTEPSGSNAISRRSATTSSSFRLSGTCGTKPGGSTTSSLGRTGGRRLSRRPNAAADRDLVRRLPLGELQHPDENVHRMECRLREMPRRRRRARSDQKNAVHRQSIEARRCAGRRCLHPVPLAGAAPDQSDRGSLLRLARRLPARRVA